MSFFRKICAVSLLTLSLASSTTTSFAQETEDVVTAEENYFSPEQIAEWETSILNKINSQYPLGDVKAVPHGISFRKPFGGWTWRDGVICIADSHAVSPLFNNGHAGIVAVAPYYDATIEANPADGVQPKYGHWNTRFGNGMVYQIGVKSTSVAQDQQAAQWATNQIGKSYNFDFGNIHRRDKFYCSQLVWAAYKDTTGVDIGTWEWGAAIHPFELMNSSKTVLIYRNK